MRGVLNKLVHRLGFDIRTWPPVSETNANLVRILEHGHIDLVLDIGANVGQYATALRQAGYTGRMVLFEPGSEAHRTLSIAARSDPLWEVADRAALGDEDGTAVLHTFNRSDMNSLAPLRAVGNEAFPRLAAAGDEEVPVRRLDAVFDRHVHAGERVFAKLDTQGTEGAVLRGAEGVIDRIAGIQIELPIVALYDRTDGFFDLVGAITGRGFELAMITPISFSKRLNRQIEVDAVFMRPPS